MNVLREIVKIVKFFIEKKSYQLNIASPQYFHASLIRPVSRLMRLNINLPRYDPVVELNIHPQLLLRGQCKYFT